MRRTLPWIVAVGALLALLTWLLARSLDPANAQYARLAIVLREVNGNEVAMQRNVLRARAGLLRNYDPLVRTMDAARSAATELRDGSPAGSALRQRAGDIEDDIAAQEPLLEKFKSGNALLQNSSAFFDQLALHIIPDERNAPLTIAAGSLAAAMLELTHMSSPEATALVDARLATLSTLADQSRAGPDAVDAAALVRHGRMLSQLVTTVDASVRTLLDTSSQAMQAAYLAQLEDDRIDGEHASERFQVALYAVALLLLALIAALAVQSRARAQAIQHRSETEHLISQLSTRLIDCASDDIDAILGEAVTTLGPAFAADRCYLLRPGDPAGCQCWHARGVPEQEDWPQAAVSLLADTDLTHIPAVSKLPPGMLRDGLQAARIGSWAGAALQHGGVPIGLIGFDRLRGGGRWPPGGRGLLGLATEVVASALHRQHVLQERMDLELRLSRARRLEAVGTFASGIAHNFNNVIGAIVGHAEMARDGMPKDETPAWHVNEIRRAGERAHELVAHILDYSSRGSQARVPLRLDTLLRETVSLLRPSLTASLMLHLPEDCHECVIAGEAAQLQQVFVNLIQNAAQASNADAAIVLEVAMIRLPARLELSHGQVGAGSHIRVGVTDTGTGMDATTLGRLFQPFHTTRPGGTGLGLATAWEIVRDHDGALNVRSTPGNGTTFQIWLPTLQENAAPAKPVRVGGDQVVMVLNPDENSRYRDEDVLAALGYEPVGYDAMEAALSASQADPDRFVAVVVDQAAAAATAALRGLPRLAERGRPIILLGSRAPDISAARLADMGIVEVIPRPFRSGMLAAALARWT